MANVDKPTGLSPYKTLTGENWNGSFVKKYSGANLFMGDVVITAATGVVNGNGGYGTVARATSVAATVALGVVVGWEFNTSNLENLYHAASTNTYAVYICVDPDMTFVVQGDGDGTVATVADSAKNFDYIIAGGSTVTGLSNFELDEDSAATTLDTPLHCVGLLDDPSNEVGAAYQRYIVMLNMHEYGGSGQNGRATGI